MSFAPKRALPSPAAISSALSPGTFHGRRRSVPPPGGSHNTNNSRTASPTTSRSSGPHQVRVGGGAAIPSSSFGQHHRGRSPSPSKLFTTPRKEVMIDDDTSSTPAGAVKQHLALSHHPNHDHQVESVTFQRTPSHQSRVVSMDPVCQPQPTQQAIIDDLTAKNEDLMGRIEVLNRAMRRMTQRMEDVERAGREQLVEDKRTIAELTEQNARLKMHLSELQRREEENYIAESSRSSSVTENVLRQELQRYIVRNTELEGMVAMMVREKQSSLANGSSRHPSPSPPQTSASVSVTHASPPHVPADDVAVVLVPSEPRVSDVNNMEHQNGIINDDNTDRQDCDDDSVSAAVEVPPPSSSSVLPHRHHTIAHHRGRSPTFFVWKLTEFYRQHNPECVSDAERIVHEFEGCELDLFEALGAKYGVPVETILD
eukprot:PhM_4_TR6800/c0_g1_i1/m.59488